MEHVTRTRCGNCDAPLTGPYCSQCGQHAHESARSLILVLHDAWHLMTHIDGRFWSTIRILLSSPGQLTLDYFADRRARHVSPLQLYLVVSIAFFAFTAANSGLTMTAAPPGPSAPATTAAPAAPAATAAAAQDATQGVVDVAIDVRDCGKISLGWTWLQARLRAACQRQIADNGKSVAHAFGSYVPKMMFIFLPLMALIMMPLYLAPRRYYVEHLVFFLHAHAALFLVMILDMLFGLVAHRLPHLGLVESVVDLATACYAAWYVYLAMRRYYGNGRALTLAKLAVVGIAYQVFLAIMVAATLLLSALMA
jgi:hypothetical protein